MPLVTKFGWTTTIIIYATLALVTMLPVNYLAKERVSVKDRKSLTFKAMWNYLSKNKYLIRINISYLVAAALATSSVANNYFAIYNLNNPNLISLLMLLPMVPMFILTAILPRLIKKFGKKKLSIFGYGLASISYFALYFLGYDSVPLTIFLIMVAR